MREPLPEPSLYVTSIRRTGHLFIDFETREHCGQGPQNLDIRTAEYWHHRYLLSLRSHAASQRELVMPRVRLCPFLRYRRNSVDLPAC